MFWATLGKRRSLLNYIAEVENQLRVFHETAGTNLTFIMLRWRSNMVGGIQYGFDYFCNFVVLLFLKCCFIYTVWNRISRQRLWAVTRLGFEATTLYTTVFWGGEENNCCRIPNSYSTFGARTRPNINKIGDIHVCGRLH